LKQSPLPPRVGRYEIVDRLGAGGMGEVYLATDPLLQRTVAVKVLPGGDEELRERFNREARSAASLRHTNVVTIYDIGEDHGQPFIAMEFVDGESMAEIIHRKAPLTVAQRLQMIIELCAGLGHAHRVGIIHRDIKPGNMMITIEGTLKVLDFGLARLLASASQTGLTRAGTVLGTPHYMSPEQIEGTPVDQRSDIFSVGLVLYELLSYQKAFSGESAHVVLHNILHKTPTPIRELLPTIDLELERIVAKGLEKSPPSRYQALEQLSSDLDRVRGRLTDETDVSTVVRPSRLGVRQRESDRRAGRTPGGTPRNLEALAQRRVAQVEAHLAKAATHFTDGDFAAAISECENALLLDPRADRALDLLDRAQLAIEDAQAGRWLQEARALLSSGELTSADALIEQSLKLRPDSAEAQVLQRASKERRRERERELERRHATQAAIARARMHLSAGAFEAAMRAASEALSHDAANADALQVKNDCVTALENARRDPTTQLEPVRPQPMIAGALRDLHRDLSQQQVRTIEREQEAPASVPSVDHNEAQADGDHQERGLGWFIPALVIVVSLLAGVILWALLHSRETPSVVSGHEPTPIPSRQASSPTTKGTAFKEAEKRIEAAWEQFTRGDPAGALKTALAVPASLRNDSATRLFVSIRDDADGRARATRAAAEAAGKSAHPAFKQADLQYSYGLQTAASDIPTGVAILEDVVRLYKEAINETPASKRRRPTIAEQAAHHVQQGEEHHFWGRYEEAAKSFESALKVDPRDTRAIDGLTRTLKAQAAQKKR
jgi:serine/threonine protein kinase